MKNSMVAPPSFKNLSELARQFQLTEEAISRLIRLAHLRQHFQITLATDPIQLYYPFEYIKPLLMSNKKYLAMIGSNRLSKTTWMCYDLASFAMGRHPNPRVKTPRNAQIWISVEKNDKVDQVIEPKFRELMSDAQYEYNQNKHSFYVKCGMNNWSEIHIKSEEADLGSYESAKLARAACDEQPLEEVWDAILVRLSDLHGQMLVGATMWEYGVTFLYDRLITPVLENRPEASMIELVGMDLPSEANPMLDKAEFDELRRQLRLRSPEEAAVRFDGKYIPVSMMTPFPLEALKMYRDLAKTVEAEDAELEMGGFN